MSRTTRLLTPYDFARLSNLQVLAEQVMEGFCAGLHRSPHHGHSVEFREHRAYVTGDEIRTIDWKLYGKTDRLYIRQYEEETNLRAMLLVDQSGSMKYSGKRSQGITKHHYAVRLAACLGYLMMSQQDGVGLLTFDTQSRDYIPPRSKRTHLHGMFAALSNSQPAGETDLGQVLRELAPKVHRRGLLVLISDCFGDVNSLIQALTYYRHAHYDVIVFQIWDPDELDFPFSQRTEFKSLEATHQKQLIDPAALRRRYLERLSEYRMRLADGFRQQRIAYKELTTDQPYANALGSYLAMRRGRL